MQDEAQNSAMPAWLRTMLIGRRPKRTLIRLIVLVVTSFVVFRFILLPVRVQGPSMLPTYPERSVNFINRLAFLWHEPRRGDIVSIRLADANVSHVSIMYLKRIVGLPGETVAFVGGQLVIDGKVFEEPYVKLPCNWERAPVTLGPNEYFVVGDNRSMPMAYHTFGKVERWRIVGKLVL